MTSKPLQSILRLPVSLREELALRCFRPAVPAAGRSNSSVPAQRLPSPSRCYSSARTRPSSSVNQNEVAHFNALASTWWDPQGSSRLLHLMNPIRHRFIQQCLQTESQAQASSASSLTYLDIGCGGGIFAESAARLNGTKSVTALDPTPEVIQVARQHQCLDPLLLEPGRLTYLNTAIEDLPLPTTSAEGFDVVSVFEVVEHIQNPAPFLETAMQHLKPGGWLVGSTIARTALSWFTTKLVAEELIRLVPRGTHDWNQYIQPDELQSWARKQPLLDPAQNKIMGVVYVPAIGWREVQGSESLGNYFFAFRKHCS